MKNWAVKLRKLRFYILRKMCYTHGGETGIFPDLKVLIGQNSIYRLV